MKYLMQVVVDAEQFLPKEDKIPKGVMSDGPRSPRTDSRCNWIMTTDDGTIYLNDGDYVITGANGGRYIMRPEVFEANYKLMES